MPKPKPNTSNHMPVAPWIYVTGTPGHCQHASKLAALIPKAIHVGTPNSASKIADLLEYITYPRYRDTIIVFSDDKSYQEEHTNQMPYQLMKETSIKHGCNLTSVNISKPDQDCKKDGERINHLELIDDHTEITAEGELSLQMFKWLFTVLTVPEQLYLIPDSQMKEIDQTSPFKDYTYCSISESQKYTKDAKIQFVALIMTKPQVGPDQRLQWQVVDKTGVANFYFQYRGASSQYSWDWVLALKPGDRKCLPRMPMVQIKERILTTVIKAPFRASAAVVNSTGTVAKGIGHALCEVGRKIKLGDRSEWILEADITTDPKGRKVKIARQLQSDKCAGTASTQTKAEIKVFNEKGEKVWKDDDSITSTAAGSVIDEKKTMEFV